MYSNTEKTTKKSLLTASLLAASAVFSTSAAAAQIEVEVSNLTQGIYFTPLLVVAHDKDNHLFQTGMAASDSLQAMAEGGALDGLIADAEAMGAKLIANPAGGLLNPATSVKTMMLDTEANEYLSITSMILPSNDGFVGLDGWKIPQQPGMYTLYLNAYDAGTEANDERVIEGSGMPGVAGIPANPGGNGGEMATGVTDMELVDKVHIHRGNVGDTDMMAGASDLDSRIHRWLNPVAKVVVTVKGEM